MAKGTGTYDDPIICDGLFSKTIDGVKKFFKIKTGSSVDTSNFIKKTGDIVNGQLTISDNYYIQKTDDAHHLRINGCTANDQGAGLLLFGKDWAEAKGYFDLVASDGVTNRQLIGTPDGSFQWDGKEIERVNSIGSNYIRYESGLQIEWNKFTTTAKKEYINFIMPFKESPVMRIGLDANVNDNEAINFICYAHPSLTNFLSLTNMQAGMVLMYIAIGKWK